MIIPTVQQYKTAILDLMPKQLEALQALYDCPNASATVEVLAQKIYPSNPAALFATEGIIGRAGKQMVDFFGIVPKGTEIPSEIIGPPYKRNVGGWRMHTNLQLALEELNLVRKK